MRRIGVCLFVVALAAAGEAIAQSYAIASLVGRELSFASSYPTLETSAPFQLPRQALADPVFDDAAVAAVKLVLRKADPQRKLVELAVSDPVSIAAAKMAPGPDSPEFRTIVEAIAAVARPAGVERLVLILPHRHELVVPTSQGNRGIGLGTGLGLYLDQLIRTRDADSREVAVRMLGAFAHFRIALVDIASGRVLAEDTVANGATVSATRSPDEDSFNAIPAREKVAVLKELVRSGIADRLPALLDRAGR